MGELPCLRRSFSQPSGGLREAKEGDPFRALGESVSFGRFLSDSLAWEKWSAFSHNRYLEEVEKFARPGSVAEKKAYFEAHYKKKAAERAAALLEATNVVTTSSVTEPPVTEDRKCNDSSVDSDMVKGESRVDEQQEIAVANNVTVFPVNSNSSVERVESNVSKLEGAVVVTQESIDLENSNPVEIPKPFENDEKHNKIDSTKEENMFDSKEAAVEEIIASASKKRSSSSSSKSLSQNKASKTLLSPAKQTTRLQTAKGNNLASRSKNFMEDMINKKSAKSLHMSIHYSSNPGGESSKTPSPIIEKIKGLKNFTASLSVSKNSSASSQTKTKVFVNELKRPTLNLKSEDKSNNPLVNKSVAERKADQKQNSPSKENSKSPNGKGSKPRSSIITSPFSLRSEERAAKRKEFYEKLEQKRKVEEAEKKQPQTRYQYMQEVKKLRQSTGLKAKPNEDLCSGSELSTSHIKKIPLTRPRSPLLGRKATASKNSDATSRPSAQTENSKCIVNKRSTNWSVTSRLHLQKNARENASPNIQSSAPKKNR